jgi:signal transduction histidine kinase
MTTALGEVSGTWQNQAVSLTTAPSPLVPGTLRPLGTSAITFLVLAYPALFILGYALKPWPNAPAALWPGYAIPFVAYLRLAPKWWPLVALVGAGWEIATYPLIDRFVTGAYPGIGVELALAGANILTAVIPAALSRFLDVSSLEDPALPNPSPLWLLAFPLGVLPGALLGTLAHSGFVFTPELAQDVAIWEASAVLGIITFSPVVYALIPDPSPVRTAPARPWELLAVGALTSALSAWLMLVKTPWATQYPPQFLFGVPLMWLALRFSRAAVSYGVMVAALTVCAASAQDFGAFAGMASRGVWAAVVFPMQLFLVTACGGAHLINLLALKEHTLVAALGRTNERLHQYAHQLDEAEDSARRATAADLHDGVGQLLAGQAMLLGALKPMVAGTMANTLLEDATFASHEAQKGIRTMIQDLSPPELEETSIERVLDGLARLFETRYRFTVNVRVSGSGPISAELLRVSYRVVRELLFNAYKHSRTDRADVIVDQFQEHIDIAVVDRGVGFDAARRTSADAPSFGLLHLFERLRAVGGSVDFDSAPDQGCRANVRLPLHRTNGTVPADAPEPYPAPRSPSPGAHA